MYALIIGIAVLSPAGGAVTPVGVTSQVLGKSKNLDQCKAAGNKQGAGGATAESKSFKRSLLVLRLRGAEMSAVGTEVGNVPAGSARKCRQASCSRIQ